MMKKTSGARPTPVAIQERAVISKSAAFTQPLEKTKTDTNIPHNRKTSKTDSNNLSKNLSKSHDNLASILRKRAAAATLAGNKENIRDRGGVLSPAPVTFKGSRGPPITPIRKAQSAHNIDDSGTPMKRAQSAQNISKAASASTSTPRASARNTAVKRASSTQNVNKGVINKRVSTPTNAMAHNAELLATFEKERKCLEGKISELIQCSESRKADIEKNKFKLNRLSDENKDLKTENRLLRDKLGELGVTEEHLTDADKLQLMHGRGRGDEGYKGGATGVDAHAGSTRASSVHRDGSEGEYMSTHFGPGESERALSIGELSCLTPEHPSSVSFDNWDTKSNKSSDATSEISVACLQDRILQMEENHYSTNEELEAHRLELADLQDTVNALTGENECLAEDKSVLLESLCAQTEKLENCRMQIEHLKILLVGDSEFAMSQKEQQLVELIKSAQLEKDELLLREKELHNQLHHAENNLREQQDVITALRDTTHINGMKIDSLSADKRALEAQVAELKEQNAKDHIELARYRTLLENEKQKVAELEQERNATNKSDLEDLLDNTRTEKERLEERLANVEEDLAVRNNEVTKLQESLASLEQEIKVCKNNAKTEVSNLSYKLESQEQEKTELQQDAEALREHVDQLQQDCDRYLEENRQHLTSIDDLETELRKLKDKETEMDKKITEEQRRFGQEKEDWQQFQLDLQMAVKVAADFKTEAQEDMERLVAERHFYFNKTQQLQEQVSSLEDELYKYKSQQQRSESDILLKRNELRGKMISTVDRELVALRTGQKLTDSRAAGKESTSVKHLIATIEKQVHERVTPPLSPGITTCSESGSSRRNSTDSTMSLSSVKSNTSPKVALERRTSHEPVSPFKSVLRRTPESRTSESRSPLGHRHTISNIIMDAEDTKKVRSPPSVKSTTETDSSTGKKPLTGILSNKSSLRKNSISNTEEVKGDKSPYHGGVQGLKTDPLAILAKQMGGSKRNALLKWCQNKLATYPGIDITNFSSSWNDGLAFCALMHLYVPHKIPYAELNSQEQLKNFTLAFNAAKSEGIPSHLNISDMVSMERPDWQAVMTYVTNIYKHFEIDTKL